MPLATASDSVGQIRFCARTVRYRVSVWQRLRALFSRKTIGADLRAGLLLGVESIPDGLASGLLAEIDGRRAAE